MTPEQYMRIGFVGLVICGCVISIPTEWLLTVVNIVTVVSAGCVVYGIGMTISNYTKEIRIQTETMQRCRSEQCECQDDLYHGRYT